MSRAVQTRVVLAGLARMGRPGLLQGQDCGPVYVQHDVDLAPGNYDTASDNHIVRATIATVAASYGSKTGNTVEILDEPGGDVIERYRLDRLVGDNGITRKHIAVKVAL